MAVVATQTNPTVRTNVATGRYLENGTAVAFQIACGFKPRYVKVVNVTDSIQVEWFEGMADASANKTIAAGTKSLITTLGITPDSRGFTVGLDLGLNVVNKQLSWIALG